jgi:hypothetical protein
MVRPGGSAGKRPHWVSLGGDMLPTFICLEIPSPLAGAIFFTARLPGMSSPANFQQSSGLKLLRSDI